MLFDFITLAAGLFLVGFGADKLVDGASGVARRLRVSDLLIGLTIVSFGTSAPELVVNVFASLKGSSEISLGNVIGSNIFNITAVVGASAVVSGVRVKHSTLRKEIPLSLIATVALLGLCSKSPSFITRGDGVVLLSFFAIFVSYVTEMARRDRELFESTATQRGAMPLWNSVLYVLAGLLALSFGGRWIVDAATNIARAFGVTEKLVGLSLVAAGTSIPEFATSLAASLKGNDEIALGNAVGSNIFNVFFILGVSAAIRPIAFNSAFTSDLLILTFVTSILLLLSRDLRIGRIEGLLLLTVYAAYVYYIVLRG